MRIKLSAFTLVVIASLECAVLVQAWQISPAISGEEQHTFMDPTMLTHCWDAKWIEVPLCDPQGYGVYLFRRTIELESIPDHFPVLVTADNRYKLYVNGVLVSLGPARGDVDHWNFEEVDLAPWLHEGNNVVSAKVWNEGPKGAMAQMTLRTGFLLQGASREAEVLNSNNQWRCAVDPSSSICSEGKALGWLAVSPGETMDMSKRIVGWELMDFDDSEWVQANPFSVAAPKLCTKLDPPLTWRLVPSSIPPVELKEQQFASVRRSEGAIVPEDGFTGGIEIPANTKATILLDNGVLTNAFPTYVFNGGAGAVVSITYAESLFDDNNSKGNRNEIDGKHIIGRVDKVLTDGSEGQEFTTLFYRSYRYVEIEVVTAADPLSIDEIHSTFIGYPFKLNASLDTDDEEIQKIFSIGWWTARLCAVDTYMDCPYFEQLQYGGDSRIQALVSIYNSGDARLMRNMIRQIDESRQPEGVTLSRYPSKTPQIIPTYSLSHIWTLHDYMMYVDDPQFVKDMLPGVRIILSYFEKFQQEDGSLRDVPNWTFLDWNPGFNNGMAPVGSDGSSANLDLYLLLSYIMAADLEQEMGMEAYAVLYHEKAKQLGTTIQSKYWDDERALYADSSDKDTFSQHANALALLCSLAEGDRAKEIALKLQDDESLSQATIYFRHYVHEAMSKAGLADNYLSWLGIWRAYIDLGLSTWGEKANLLTTRSDCHAWGSTPNIEFFRTILGVDSAAPGFSEVAIKPALGQLREFGGTMPHPKGQISVKYKLDDVLKAEISLPEGVGGKFYWNGEIVELKPGLNTISLPAGK